MELVNPKRILILGDVHGNLKRTKAAIHAAVVTDCDAVFQLGDLGVLWPGENPKTFDAPLVEGLAKAGGMPFGFLDGNHDNHIALRSLQSEDSGFVEVLPGIWWAPRAHRWEWSGITLASMGGAYSVDRVSRIEGKSLWSGIEEVQQADVNKLGSARVDVLLTHDAPFGVPVRSTMKLESQIEQDSLVGRHLLRTAVENVEPQLVLSGHHHQRISYALPFTGGTARCEVLDTDGRFGNAVILNLPDLTIEEPPPGWHQWTRRSERQRQRKDRAQQIQAATDQAATDPVAADGLEADSATNEVARGKREGSP